VTGVTNVTERRKNLSQQAGLGQVIQEKRNAKSADLSLSTWTNR
jgi:hypothetical protein